MFPGSLGTEAVKVFDRVAAGTGLRDQAAREAGHDPVTVATTADDHKAYYPGATDVQVRITGDRHTGRLLGAQLLGHRSAEVANASTSTPPPSLTGRPSRTSATSTCPTLRR